MCIPSLNLEPAIYEPVSKIDVDRECAILDGAWVLISYVSCMLRNMTWRVKLAPRPPPSPHLPIRPPPSAVQLQAGYANTNGKCRTVPDR